MWQVSRYLLSEKNGFSAGPLAICEALDAQRGRLAQVLSELPPEAWQAQSRCTEWSVHEVIRHLCDVLEIHVDRLRGCPTRFAEHGAFHPARTPALWLAESNGELP